MLPHVGRFGVVLIGALGCSPPDSAFRDSGLASGGSAAGVDRARPRAPLGRRYALARLRSFGPYVKGGRGSPVRVTTDVLAETLSFADSSADSGTVIRRRVDRVRESLGGRVTLERIDTTVRTDSFRRTGDTIVLITPWPRFTFLHTFAMRAGGDTLETTAQRCLPSPCGGTSALPVWLYGRIGPPWWARYVESNDGQRVTLELRPGAPKIREVVVLPPGAVLGGPRYPMRVRAVVDAAPGVSRAVRWSSSDTSIVRVVPTSDTSAVVCPQPRTGEATINATARADTHVRGVGRVSVMLSLGAGIRGTADSLSPLGPCRRQ